MTKSRLPTFFISHGGGPWPWMPGMVDGPYARLAASLRHMPREIGARPAAILMVSAHWEEPVFTVQANANPPMVYDYYGFPEETYRIRYGSAGDPVLADRVAALLRGAGIAMSVDPDRGYDHGMYAPMAIAWPNADIPTVQLSLKVGLDPLAHIEVGRALAVLREENVLIVGSGLSYHNLRNFGPGAAQASGAFDAWLHSALTLPPRRRVEALLEWEAAPAARSAHPREEHLLPLMVAVGAAEEETAHAAYHEPAFMGGITVSSFRFGRGDG